MITIRTNCHGRVSLYQESFRFVLWHVVCFRSHSSDLCRETPIVYRDEERVVSIPVTMRKIGDTSQCNIGQNHPGVKGDVTVERNVRARHACLAGDECESCCWRKSQRAVVASHVDSDKARLLIDIYVCGRRGVIRREDMMDTVIVNGLTSRLGLHVPVDTHHKAPSIIWGAVSQLRKIS